MNTIKVEDAVGLSLAHDITEIRPGEFKGVAFKKGHKVEERIMKKRISILLIFLLVIWGEWAGAEESSSIKGKFVIVGMGTAPDLITIRAQNVVQKAELILLENESDRQMWQSPFWSFSAA